MKAAPIMEPEITIEMAIECLKYSKERILEDHRLNICGPIISLGGQRMKDFLYPYMNIFKPAGVGAGFWFSYDDPKAWEKRIEKIDSIISTLTSKIKMEQTAETPQQLTVAEAIAQGYEHYGFPDEGFQRMNYITDIEDDDFQKKPVLFEKEPNSPPALAENELKELIVEHLECQHSDLTGDDTLSVTEALNDNKEIDYASLTNQINAALEAIRTFSLTKIELIP